MVHIESVISERYLSCATLGRCFRKAPRQRDVDKDVTSLSLPCGSSVSSFEDSSMEMS